MTSLVLKRKRLALALVITVLGVACVAPWWEMVWLSLAYERVLELDGRDGVFIRHVPTLWHDSGDRRDVSAPIWFLREDNILYGTNGAVGPHNPMQEGTFTVYDRETGEVIKQRRVSKGRVKHDIQAPPWWPHPDPLPPSAFRTTCFNCRSERHDHCMGATFPCTCPACK